MLRGTTVRINLRWMSDNGLQYRYKRRISLCCCCKSFFIRNWYGFSFFFKQVWKSIFILHRSTRWWIYSLTESGSYTFASGTSMAAPMVSGGLAIIMEEFSSLTPAQVVTRLLSTASVLVSIRKLLFMVMA